MAKGVVWIVSLVVALASGCINIADAGRQAPPSSVIPGGVYIGEVGFTTTASLGGESSTDSGTQTVDQEFNSSGLLLGNDGSPEDIGDTESIDFGWMVVTATTTSITATETGLVMGGDVSGEFTAGGYVFTADGEAVTRFTLLADGTLRYTSTLAMGLEGPYAATGMMTVQMDGVLEPQ